MDPFTAGDRVVAINTNLTAPIAPPSDPDLHPIPISIHFVSPTECCAKAKSIM